MTPQSQILLIPKIECGYVIDHIPAGLGIQVMALIGCHPELEAAVVTLGLNSKSTRMGRKDMIKLQTKSLARCINPNCITNVEPHIGTRFKRLESGSRHFKCAHCERVCTLDELAGHLKA